MAMEALGRLCNVAPIAAGQGISLKNCTGIMFVCTGNDTFTLTVATSFAGSYVTPPTTTIGGGLIRVKYTNPQTNGTGVWTRTKLASGSYVNAVTISSGTVVFHVYPIDLAGDPSGTNYSYIECSVGSAGLVAAFPYDLMDQRNPANLAALGA